MDAVLADWRTQVVQMRWELAGAPDYGRNLSAIITQRSQRSLSPPLPHKSVLRIIGLHIFLQWDRKNKNTGANKTPMRQTATDGPESRTWQPPKTRVAESATFGLSAPALGGGGASRSSSFGNAGSCESAFEGKQPAPGDSAALGQTHRVKNGTKPIGEKKEGVTIPRMFKISHNSAPTGGGTTIKASDFGSTRDVAALTVEGDSTGSGRLASLDSGGLPQVKVDVGGSRSLDAHNTTIMAQHKQTQRDSKKARVAMKQLQVAVSKVAKPCSEIGERITAIECRADVLESDLGAVTKQAAMHETQLYDIQWKVEDFENRQRRNNLRLVGIQEGEVVITPQLVLLGIDGVVYLEYSKRFLFLAMSVARWCITSDWLEPTPPTFNHWLARMCSTFYLEMGSYARKGRTRRQIGEAIWAPFAQWLGNN
ncbi:hypothetical protein NDU88_003571 [Pleurodeles waltl]|uniref:Uncharacterized protein n=1 Tax=Pleurodeles waltl TaxID=8319 RepID=A0AAV7MYX8_PLEWA|nr:hypothetical protein NDU88_003571 [Pleurodeles waltl]